MGLEMKHWKYLKYVLRHKLYVYQAGRELGLGRLQLVLHDLSKFSFVEWDAYVETFYGDEPELWSAKFDAAWNHHQKKNPHHWQYYALPLDDGGTKLLEIPDKYRREMLADWRGAGRAIHGHDETASWYQKNKSNMQLHPQTRDWIEEQLGAQSPE